MAKDKKETMKQLNWKGDGCAAEWNLLNEIQKPENSKVLLGKERGEV
jgi:hypothetical protein